MQGNTVTIVLLYLICNTFEVTTIQHSTWLLDTKALYYQLEFHYLYEVIPRIQPNTMQTIIFHCSVLKLYYTISYLHVSDEIFLKNIFTKQGGKFFRLFLYTPKSNSMSLRSTHDDRHFGASFTFIGGVKAEISMYMSQNTEKDRIKFGNIGILTSIPPIYGST